jgi:hypothetical protein
MLRATMNTVAVARADETVTPSGVLPDVRWVVGISLTVVAALLGGFVWLLNSSLTECFAGFESRAQAERAASVVESVGFTADVEAAGPDERKPTSEWGRGIGVRFSDGATGEDAKEFKQAVREAVDQEAGDTGRRGPTCSERPRVN